MIVPKILNAPLFWFGAAASSAYWPDDFRGGLAPKWTVIEIGLPLLLIWKLPPRLGSAQLWMLAFIAYAALSIAWAPVWLDGADGAWKLTVLFLAFLLGSAQEIEPLVMGAGVGVTISGIAALPQWGVMQPIGIFAQKDFMGEAAVLVLIGAVAWRRWWMVPGPALALVVSGSRGALFAAIITGLVAIPLRWRSYAVGALPVIVLVVLYYSPVALIDLGSRFPMWADIVAGLHWLGNGSGSLWDAFPLHQTHSSPLEWRVEHAHDDLLELVFDFGVAALIPAAVMVYGLGANVAARLVLAAFVVEGITGFPLFEPVAGLLGAACLGACVADRQRSRHRMDGGLGDLGERMERP